MSRTSSGNLRGRAARVDDLDIPFVPTETMAWNSQQLPTMINQFGIEWYRSRFELTSEELKAEIEAEYAEAWKALGMVLEPHEPVDLEREAMEQEIQEILDWLPFSPEDERDERMNQRSEVML